MAPDQNCGNPSVGEAFECLGLSWAGFVDDVSKGKNVWDTLQKNYRAVYMTVSIALGVILLAIVIALASYASRQRIGSGR